LYGRISGARLGQLVGGTLPGGRSAGLVEAEAGSRYVQALRKEIPAMLEFEALEEILLNPEMLAMAIRKPRSDSEKQSIFRQLMGYLSRKGLAAATAAPPRAVPLGAKTVTEPEPEMPEAIKAGKNAVPLPPRRPENLRRSLPPPTQAVPKTPVQAPTPVAQAPAPASPSPVDRARLAAAFPNDPVLKLMG